MKTVNQARKEILRELHLDVTTTTIQRDQALGYYKERRNKKNNYRMFTEEEIEVLKFIALLRNLGIQR